MGTSAGAMEGLPLECSLHKLQAKKLNRENHSSLSDSSVPW